eukprot:GFKZ01008699.1.p1 GENE.GFKZ01008699.1~~GFKZ01008699.1.p1  ORF type:complete len:179 (-),score=12.30 GFKZ01008699.1:521-1057(-)
MVSIFFTTLLTFVTACIAQKATDRQSGLDGVSVDCVVQAFGSDLSDKGIYVEVQEVGFGCNPLPWRTVSGSAKFVNGEAEVPLRLQANTFGICMTRMIIRATFDYNCVAVDRTVFAARWTFGSVAQGSCRALRQNCAGTFSNAAVPYVDMYCRRPPSTNGGRTEELRMDWFRQPGDGC